MAIVNASFSTRRLTGAAMIEAVKLGIECELTGDNQLEFSCSYNEKIDLIVDKFGGNILSRHVLQPLKGE